MLKIGLLALAVAAFVSGCGGSDDHNDSTGLVAEAATVNVLSNRADMISGGDALVEVKPVSGLAATDLVVEANGTDVTSSFKTWSDGRFVGLVTGLVNGDNQLSVRAKTGSAKSTAKIVNHSSGGPIFYGPRATPWHCDAGATDENCTRPVSYTYAYISTDTTKVGFQPYNPGAPATDVATATTSDGRSAPFIVRIEKGVQDRDYYAIASLFDPSKPWTADAPQTTWNKSAIFMHGSGCGQGYGQSGATAPDGKLTTDRVMDQYALSKGYLVLMVALNDSGHNCIPPLQAEAQMMAKEHLIEAYGIPDFVFGYGGSGGAIAQHWMANGYPGLYDGIIASNAFADYGTDAVEAEDCSLLLGYYSKSSLVFTDVQRQAIQGSQTAVCNGWLIFHDLFDPTTRNVVNVPGAPTYSFGVSDTILGGCDAPADKIFEPTFRPDGIRCSYQDYASGIFGKGSDGRSPRPYSNVGLQYGLAALVNGVITPEQFVDLNTNVGSHTLDYVFQPRRVGAEQKAAENAYRSSWFNEMNNVGDLPILHLRRPDLTSVHHQFRSWSVRARLEAATGSSGNLSIWYNAGTQNESYDVMTTWIKAIKADTSTRSKREKTIANRPVAAKDRCGAADGTGMTMIQCTGQEDANPRIAAGGPFTDDVLLCKLKPLSRSEYTVIFTDAQWAALQATFPTGVCDYTQPGNGQQGGVPWMTYLAADGSPIYGGMAMSTSP